MSSAALLPTWDLSNLYASFTSDAYRADFARLGRELSELAELCDARGIRRSAAPPDDPEPALAAVAVELIDRASRIALLADALECFIWAHVSTDSRDAVAAAELSRYEQLDTRRRQLAVRIQGWIGSLGARLEALIAADATLARHAFFLRDTARQSQYLMDEPLEQLAAEMAVDGAAAFGKLQGSVTSQLKAALRRGDAIEELPIAAIRNLSFDPDETVRRAAYEAEMTAWRSVQTTVAACLNGIKGTALTLARRRGRASVLDWSLDQNRIDRDVLEALMSSIHAAFPMFRRYLRSKAAKLGKPRLAWWDLFAPVGASHTRYAWPAAREFIVGHFAHFSDELGGLAARAFDNRWIDAEPREGKRGGAFCMGVLRTEESRVLANFDGSFEQVMTLAHELGHAFHNHCQSGLEPLRRGAPSALAETASTFCETLVVEAAQAESDRDERLAMLEAQLVGATQVCLDIYSRYLFENAILDRRRERELSHDEFCSLMRDAQRDTYADAVDAATYHPYMWLLKPHYYAHEHNFYNFPYAFGHLFSLGLFARYRQLGPAFVPQYCELLRGTGENTARDLAARFGIDLATNDFWQGALAIVAEQVERYEAAS